MRKAKILFNAKEAGFLIEDMDKYFFEYIEGYLGPPISLTMQDLKKRYEFEKFPPFFDGVLPEGPRLEALLRQAKLDRTDYFGQLITVGADLIGAITVEEIK